MIKIISLLLIICSLNVNASIKISGSFKATQSCPAYVSKNNKTNPGYLMVQPNHHYQLVEINKKSPDWVRIEFPESTPSLRWVDLSCGVLEYQQLNSLGSCDVTSGMADSHVLAMSLQAGFCQTYGYEAAKPECLKLSKNSYEAKHLTLHGLWPNQDACGQQYGFCGVRPQSNHCSYSPVNLSTMVENNLKKMMPSFNYGSCLERHEWNKHGSCQSLSSDDYFSLAMRLTTEVDNSPFGQYLAEHNGSTVKLESIHRYIEQSFGKNNANKIILGCRNGILVDVYIVLPALIPFDESLVTLVKKAPEFRKHDSCPNNVTISNFNRGSLY